VISGLKHAYMVGDLP